MTTSEQAADERIHIDLEVTQYYRFAVTAERFFDLFGIELATLADHEVKELIGDGSLLGDFENDDYHTYCERVIARMRRRRMNIN
ncbi:hypothetical protein ACQPW1_10325 [Nocardia sp. CA-128927]|uniref:hypothetical protein n=1 Tax=Nocardia sp. CA-128927 TaxID=3239975 RepID=UPI003D98B172